MKHLEYLEDIIKLKIKSVSELPEKKRKKLIEIEERVKEKYKAPSLPAYLLFEYHFNDNPMLSLAPKIGIVTSTLSQIMRDLEIPKKPSKREILEKEVRKKYRMSLYGYVSKKYDDEWSLRKIAKQLGTSYQTISNIMEENGKERRTLEEASELNKGKTHEQRYGAERAEEIKAKLSGNSPTYGKPIPKKTREKIARTLTGRKHTLESRKKMSRAKRRL
jgi:transcriptional regulator with XRE-family HTH domain